MALAFRISHPNGIARLFAAYDEYSTIVNDLFGRTLTPNDDFYTAPYAFMPCDKNSGFIVMTCQVPWLHGHGYYPGTQQEEQQHGGRNTAGGEREQHFERARRIMKDAPCKVCQLEDIPFLEMGPEKMQAHLKLGDGDIVTFTKDGCYPCKDDICQELEDNAVRVTCGAMGWDMPANWRQERERQGRLRCVVDVFDLAECDTATNNGAAGNKRMRYTIDSQAALNSRQEDDQESVHERQEEGGGSDGQQMNHPIEQYGTLISRESGEHNEKEDALHDSHHGGAGHESDGQQLNNTIDSYGAPAAYYESFDDRHGDTFYDEDSNIIDENENHHSPSRVGFGNVKQRQKQQQQSDAICDVIDESTGGITVEI